MEANGIGHIVGIKIDILLAPVRKYTRTGKTCLVLDQNHYSEHCSTLVESCRLNPLLYPPPPFTKK